MVDVSEGVSRRGRASVVDRADVESGVVAIVSGWKKSRVLGWSKWVG